MLEWSKLPSFVKKDAVKPYYISLLRKKRTLLLKRIFDVVVAFLLLVILLLPMVVISIIIVCDSKGGVFYCQERVTKFGKLYKIIKFRTMVSGADRLGSLVTEKSDRRITKVGEKLRKHRLDEIPQLFNVLMGDMSFVGTRPEVMKYVSEYSDEMKATLLLPAGITSPASIEFKNEDEILEELTSKGMTMDEAYIKEVLPIKMKYNLDYTKNFSFWGDIKIMIRTVFEVSAS